MAEIKVNIAKLTPIIEYTIDNGVTKEDKAIVLDSIEIADLNDSKDIFTALIEALKEAQWESKG